MGCPREAIESVPLLHRGSPLEDDDKALTDYDQRASLFGYKGASFFAGVCVWFVFGIVFSATYPNDVHAQIIIPAIIFVIIVLLAFGQMLMIVEEPVRTEKQIKADAESDPGLVPMIRRLCRNQVYWRCGRN